MNLHWHEYADPIFGRAYELVGLPEGASANAHRRGTGCYVANAYFPEGYGSRFLSHQAKTMRSAVKRLESEIDKRSIGLLGVDIVTFEGES